MANYLKNMAKVISTGLIAANLYMPISADISYADSKKQTNVTNKATNKEIPNARHGKYSAWKPLGMFTADTTLTEIVNAEARFDSLGNVTYISAPKDENYNGPRRPNVTHRHIEIKWFGGTGGGRTIDEYIINDGAIENHRASKDRKKSYIKRTYAPKTNTATRQAYQDSINNAISAKTDSAYITRIVNHILERDGYKPALRPYQTRPILKSGIGVLKTAAPKPSHRDTLKTLPYKKPMQNKEHAKEHAASDSLERKVSEHKTTSIKPRLIKAEQLGLKKKDHTLRNCVLGTLFVGGITYLVYDRTHKEKSPSGLTGGQTDNPGIK
ncbi:MAG: hypothetical protein AABW41_02680 [Nanoarchaeota archaeon]